MKRLLTALLLLCIVTPLLAQKKAKNKTQSFWSIETGAPISVTTYQEFPIPLTIEFQKKKKQWALGASLALQYDTYSWGDCSKRIPVGTILFPPIDQYSYYNLRAYCETYQYLDLKPAIFGSYYFMQKKNWNVFAKLGGIATIPVLTHQKGEYYEVEITRTQGTTIQVIRSEPVHLEQNIKTSGYTIALLSGLGVHYFLNKKTAVRFTLQSEWNSGILDKNTDRGVLLFALGGLTIKI